jgi:FAD/FMN-containing dehydrogenase
MHRMLRTESIGVDVLTATDEGWDDARRAWSLLADQQPAAVAFPEDAVQIQTVVDAARAAGLRVAAQSGGHGAVPLGPLDDTVLIRTSRVRGVTIDADRRVARAAAGDEWRDVTVPAGAYGLATLAGTAPDVGVVGYTLGGGIGWLARRHGLACNRVRAVELVLADGTLVRCDADHDAELFWALRGGGGSFGVVTAIEFDLLPIASVYGGALFWPMERAPAVLHAWREWVGEVSGDTTSCARLLRVPPLPHVPAPLRGRAFAVIELVHAGAEADELLRPLRALAPEVDTCRPMPVSDLHTIHNDPPEPVPGITDTALLDGLPAAAVDAFIGAAGADSRSTLLGAELRHLGGALAVAPDEAGATATIDAPFSAFGVGIGAAPEEAAATETHLTRLRSALAPYETPRSYLNFVDRPCDTRAMFRPAAYMLLRQVKTRVDPDDVIRANHPIPPLGR